MESIWGWIQGDTSFWDGALIFPNWYILFVVVGSLYLVVWFIVIQKKNEKQKEVKRPNSWNGFDKKPITVIKPSSPVKPLEATVAGQLAAKIKQQEQEQVQEIVESVTSYLRSISPHAFDQTGKVHIHYKNAKGGENLNNKRVQDGVEASLERLGFSDVKVVFNSYAGNSIELRLPGHPKS